MSILILNQIRLDYVPYHEILGSGGDIYLFTDTSSIDPAELARVRSLYKHVELFDRFVMNGRVEQRAIELHKTAQFHRVVAVSEFDLIRAGRLRARFDAEGQNAESAHAFRDKVRMKELARAAGVEVPAFRPVEAPLDVLEFVEEYGLPVVVKPRLSMGSVGTSILHTSEDLRALLERGLTSAPEVPCGLEVENFVEGPMYSVDGYVYDGEIVACWPQRYTHHCYGYAQGSALGGFVLSADNPLTSRLRAFAHRLLTGMPTPKTTAFHVEVFHTPDDRLVLCEVASRVAGPRIHESWDLAHGFSLAETFIRGQAGCLAEGPRIASDGRPQRLAGQLRIPFRAARLERAPDTCPEPGCDDFLLAGELGRTYAASHNQNEYVARFRFTGGSEEEIASNIERAARWFEGEVQWSTP